MHVIIDLIVSQSLIAINFGCKLLRQRICIRHQNSNESFTSRNIQIYFFHLLNGFDFLLGGQLCGCRPNIIVEDFLLFTGKPSLTKG